MKKFRILYISPMRVDVDNGMLQRQLQWLSTIEQLFPGQTDFLTLNSSSRSVKAWLHSHKLKMPVLRGPFAFLARLNALFWYYSGILLCNKLRICRGFPFFFKTPIPQQWIERYDLLICFYGWNYHLMGLERAGSKVIVDLADVMAERHERTGSRRWISLNPTDEQSIIEGSSRCMAISAGDFEEFKRLYNVEIPIVPFVPVHAEKLLQVHQEVQKAVGFVGAPSFLNEKILAELANEDFLFALKTAGVKFIVAGGICKSCGSEILKKLQDGGAVILGEIEDISQFYRAVSAVLNPVGPSTGIKVKSVEALLAGKALITTVWGSDATLERHFEDQIHQIGWPVSTFELASACIDVTANSRQEVRSRQMGYMAQANGTISQFILANLPDGGSNRRPVG